MKLAKYLAVYIEYEAFNFVSEAADSGNLEVSIDIDELQRVIQQGLEAFCSTEDKTIEIKPVIDRFFEFEGIIKPIQGE